MRENIKVHRGKIHDYLGMYLDYSETGMVKISMIKYLKKFLDNFPEELRGISSTPKCGPSVPSKRLI